MLAAAFVLLTGCSSTVSGSGVATGTVTTTKTTTKTATTTTAETTAEEDTPSTAVEPVPTVDESAPTQYCDTPFPGALGKPMLAAVVETAGGRLNCDQAAAVLVDYYLERRDPVPGLPPLAVAGMRCNQVPEPALPQVVCADGTDLIYSMWPQT